MRLSTGVAAAMSANLVKRGWSKPWASTLAVLAVCVGAGSTCVLIAASAHEYESGIKWLEPKVVDPGPVGGHPADAIVLFDGKDLSKWKGGDAWEIRDGYAVGKRNGISTKEAFGDCQLHIEWATPAKVEGSGQGRGNSGVYLMGLYEVQILDSYDNKTYFDGQAGAIYKQHPPMVNVCRKPGEWQSYDIVFQTARFGEDHKLIRPASVTVFQNGVLLHHKQALLGPTGWRILANYNKQTPARGPIALQDHGNAVRFRNIWIRNIAEDEKP